MIQVASSFSTEPSLDVVLSSIPAQIYEAIDFLKENMDTFTAKVSLILSHPWNLYSTLCTSLIQTPRSKSHIQYLTCVRQ